MEFTVKLGDKDIKKLSLHLFFQAELKVRIFLNEFFTFLIARFVLEILPL